MTQEIANSQANSPEKKAVETEVSPISSNPPDPPAPARTSFFVRTLPLWGILLATGVWAYKGKIPVEISAQTILVTPRANTSVQARSGGQVLEIKISPGDTVTKGEAIAVLDLPELNDKLNAKQQKLRELQSQKIDLTQVQNRTNLLQKQTLQSQQKVIPQQIEAIRQQIVANQQKMSASRQQISVKRGEIKGYAQRIAQLKERTKLLEPRLASGKKLIDEGALAPLSMDIISAQKQVQDNDIQVTQMEVQSNDARAKIEQLESDLVANQAREKELNNQISGLESQLTALGAQLEQIEYESLQTNTDRDNQISDLQRDIKNLQIQIDTDSKVISSKSGKILELSVNPGQVIQAGTKLATMEEIPKNQETLAYSFFATGDAEKIRPAMVLSIVPGVEDRERYGGIVAEVTAVAPIPSTNQEVTSIVGNEELSKQILEGGKPVVKVIARLKQDSQNPSGLQWTRGEGLPYILPENTIGNAYLIVEERSFLSHLQPWLRRLTGIDADAN